ncbi:MAG TPA: hypothetical protein VFN25_07825 [Dokdonella sp.]|uniref:hypothetical protein n=1 Tax=Dokdonella sp. TaxID=2291710 RepID=UPI002D803808|nr:hypothetical protein [Dokdonella sp.]HET9032797.1 hypothetical protein [Dokdonella sp.]
MNGKSGIRPLAFIISTVSMLGAVGPSTAAPIQNAQNAPSDEIALGNFSAWGVAVAEQDINDPAAGDGCPIESPDGMRLFIASNRAGTLGANDIWVSHRMSKVTAWSTPQNLGAPVNGVTADFCPTPINDQWLFFVSERSGPETCAAGPGSGDMYLVHIDPDKGWGEPEHLGCAEDGEGPNTTGTEYSPSWLTTWLGAQLYFSSNGYNGNMDIYYSSVRWNGEFGPANRVDRLNTEFDDRMPNVRRDGREIVFSSNRPGGYGGQDVYISTRRSVFHPWSAPVNAGPNINTAGNETRASLSGDGTRLHFGRDGEIYVSSRSSD